VLPLVSLKRLLEVDAHQDHPRIGFVGFDSRHLARPDAAIANLGLHD
jgi:hypothetical protein